MNAKQSAAGVVLDQEALDELAKTESIAHSFRLVAMMTDLLRKGHIAGADIKYEVSEVLPSGELNNSMKQTGCYDIHVSIRAPEDRKKTDLGAELQVASDSTGNGGS